MNKVIKELIELSNITYNSKSYLINQKVIVNIFKEIQHIIFPGFFEPVHDDLNTYFEKKILLIENSLLKEIEFAFNMSSTNVDVVLIVSSFISKLPIIKEKLFLDVKAFYDADPAAKNNDEIILCYPGLLAITAYRIAHELNLLNVPFIPRILTEYAHSKTGIDIHPGATIGDYFFIDHGTGIVIGETTSIGNHVKIYQGVTLGAISLKEGQDLRGIKRHPTILDNVTIYAGASILGGKTIIGKNCVIGSNVFITKSILDDKVVTLFNQDSNQSKEI